MRILWLFLGLAVAACAGGTAYYYWPLALKLHAPAISLCISDSPTGVRVFIPNRVLVGELVEFDDGLFAFLMFDYLRARPALRNNQVMLTSQEESGHPVYKILVLLASDVIAGVTLLARLKEERLTSSVQMNWRLPATAASALAETKLFMDAYSGPAARSLKANHSAHLRAYMRRFIRFKSETDPRIHGSSGQIPSPLTREAASRLAADIIDVASFYGIPIDLFLGIGAMENNFMNVKGDLKNTAWKRRLQPGDIVIRRRHGRILVRNQSVGVWQITRESLWYAHSLYLCDSRDYSELPERLRPAPKLEVDHLDPELLTTYAGLLLRNLLDRFQGNVTLAAGAYNGGPGKPNLQYAHGVEMVAHYARRVIGRAVEIDSIALEQSSVSPQKITKPNEGVEQKRRAPSQ